MSGKEAFIKVMNSAAAKGGALNQYPVVIKEEISGNTAILTVETTGKNSVKSINTHRMVKEGGRWKWDITGK